jgi:hypothetical protein
MARVAAYLEAVSIPLAGGGEAGTSTLHPLSLQVSHTPTFSSPRAPMDPAAAAKDYTYTHTYIYTNTQVGVPVASHARRWRGTRGGLKSQRRRAHARATHPHLTGSSSNRSRTEPRPCTRGPSGTLHRVPCQSPAAQAIAQAGGAHRQPRMRYCTHARVHKLPHTRTTNPRDFHKFIAATFVTKTCAPSCHSRPWHPPRATREHIQG